ncbi:hypothetical protein GCM10027422_25880 [Hymenobacter arcticus]
MALIGTRKRKRYVTFVSYLLLSSCKFNLEPDPFPTPTYQLTPDELVWQGYQQGQELRFGRAGSPKVRTFRVLKVQDETQPQASSSLIPPRGTYQTITVLGQRTDSLTYIFRTNGDSVAVVDELLELYKYYNKSTGTVELRADVEWSKTFSQSLPLDAVTTNRPLQSSTVELLPTVVLGGVTYGPTLRISPQLNTVGYSPRLRAIRRVYYARGKGVVGYEEDGTGLWYRL